MPILALQPGGVQNAYVGYVQYDLTALGGALILYWPTSYQDSPNNVAAWMDIINSNGGQTITLPDATQASVGQNFIINNFGPNPFDLLNKASALLQSIPPGTAWYFILTNNSTAGGMWESIQFGAGSSSAVPAALIGYGLNADALPPSNTSKINTQIDVNPLANNITTYAIAVTDYTSMLVWTSGTGTIYLPVVSPTAPPPPGQVPPFFYVSINNAGTAPITLQSIAGDAIQGQMSLQIGPGQTLTVATPGVAVPITDLLTSKWFTLGFGQQPVSNITVLRLNVGGNSNVTLTDAEASNLIQEYSGTLTGNITIFFPVPGLNSGAQWYIYNGCTGAFTLSVQLAGPIGTAYVIPQGASQIFYADSTSISPIPYPTSGGTGTVTNVSASSTSGLTHNVTNPTTTPNISFDLPIGISGQILSTSGGLNPTLSWIPQSGGAPTNATYILQTPDNPPLTNSQALSTLTTGLLKSTTGTGVVSIAIAGTDYYAPTFPTTLQETVNGIAIGNTARLSSPIAGISVVLGSNVYNTISTNGGNIVIGIDSLVNNTSGENNIAIGQSILAANTTGSNNIAIGFQTYVNSVMAGSNNIAIGTHALQNNTADDNIAIGNTCLQSNTTASNNVIIGFFAGAATTTGGGNTAVGWGAFANNTTGSNNCAFGQEALINNGNGIHNCAFGYASLDDDNSGNYNSGFGNSTLGSNTTGSNNAAFGYGALANSTIAANNMAAGYQAAFTQLSYTNCTFLGSGADASVNALSYASAIGSGAQVGSSYSIVLGGTGAAAVNVGIGIIMPAYGLHLGAAGTAPSTFTPSIFFTSTAAPTAPTGTNNVLYNSTAGQLISYGAATLYRGSIVTANTTAGYATSGTTALSGGATPSFTITSSAIIASSIIVLSYGLNAVFTGTIGTLYIFSQTPGSAVVHSTGALDANMVNWQIINPVAL